MPRRCEICTHPSRLEIDKALIQGESYQSISKKYDVSAQSVGRHKDNHLSRQLIQAGAKRDLLHSEGLLNILENLLQTSYMVISEAWRQQSLQIALNGIAQARGCAETVAKIVWALREQDLIREEREKPLKISVKLVDDEGNEIHDLEPIQTKPVEYRRRDRSAIEEPKESAMQLKEPARELPEVDKEPIDQEQDPEPIDNEPVDWRMKPRPRREIHFEGFRPVRQRRTRRKFNDPFPGAVVPGSIRTSRPLK